MTVNLTLPICRFLGLGKGSLTKAERGGGCGKEYLPDYSAQTHGIEVANPHKCNEWLYSHCEEMRRRGMTYSRWTIHQEIPDLVLIEGWKTKPKSLPEPHFYLVAGAK